MEINLAKVTNKKDLEPGLSKSHLMLELTSLTTTLLELLSRAWL